MAGPLRGNMPSRPTNFSVLLCLIALGLIAHLAFIASKCSIARANADAPVCTQHGHVNAANARELVQQAGQGFLVVDQRGQDDFIIESCPRSHAYSCVCYPRWRDEEYSEISRIVRLISPAPSLGVAPRGADAFHDGRGSVVICAVFVSASLILGAVHFVHYIRWLWKLFDASSFAGGVSKKLNYRYWTSMLRDKFMCERQVVVHADILHVAQSAMMLKYCGLMLIVFLIGDAVSTIKSLSSYNVADANTVEVAERYTKGFSILIVVLGLVVTPWVFGRYPLTRPLLDQLNAISTVVIMWKCVFMGRMVGTYTLDRLDMLPQYMPASLEGPCDWKIPIIALRFFQVVVCGNPWFSIMLQMSITVVDVLSELEGSGAFTASNVHDSRKVHILYQAPTLLVMGLVTFCYDARLKAEARSMLAANRSDVAFALAMRVLRANSDAWVRLDEKLMLIDSSHGFANLLLYKGWSGFGGSFLGTIDFEDQERVRSYALQQANLARENPHRDDPADAVHVRFKDSMGTTVQAELFWCSSEGMDGSVTHVVGIVEQQSEGGGGSFSAGPAYRDRNIDDGQVILHQPITIQEESMVSSDCTSLASSEGEDADATCIVWIKADSEHFDIVKMTTAFACVCGPSPAPPRLTDLFVNSSFTDDFKDWLREALNTGTSKKCWLCPPGKGYYQAECSIGQVAGGLSDGMPLVFTGFRFRTKKPKFKAKRIKHSSKACPTSDLEVGIIVDMFDEIRIASVMTQSAVLRDVFTQGVSLTTLSTNPASLERTLKQMFEEPVPTWLGPPLGQLRLSNAGWTAICDNVRICGVEMHQDQQGEAFLCKLQLRGISVRRSLAVQSL